MFKSESESTARFKRLEKAFLDPMTEIHLLLFSFTLPLFTVFNNFLQRDDPCIQWIHDQMYSLLKSTLGRFVEPRVIKVSRNLLEIDFRDLSNQRSVETLIIGPITRTKLRKLENEGDINPNQRKAFLDGAREFYSEAADYMIKKLPFKQSVSQHAKFVDIKKRETCEFSDINYFVDKYSDILRFEDRDLQKPDNEFVEFQLQDDDEIPLIVREKARIRKQPEEISSVYEEPSYHFRMDTV